MIKPGFEVDSTLFPSCYCISKTYYGLQRSSYIVDLKFIYSITLTQQFKLLSTWERCAGQSKGLLECYYYTTLYLIWLQEEDTDFCFWVYSIYLLMVQILHSHSIQERIILNGGKHFSHVIETLSYTLVKSGRGWAFLVSD